MSSILPLGDKFNLARCASAGTAYVSLRDCSNVLCVVDTPGSASTITFKEATTGGAANAQVLGTASATVVPLPAPSNGAAPVYFRQDSGVWTTVPIVAGGNYVLATGVLTLVSATPDQVAVWVNQGCLSDTFDYLLATHSAKALTYIMCPLDVQRKPANIKNPYS
jgi:hypothetical protein